MVRLGPEVSKTIYYSINFRAPQPKPNPPRLCGKGPKNVRKKTVHLLRKTSRIERFRGQTTVFGISSHFLGLFWALRSTHPTTTPPHNTHTHHHPHTLLPSPSPPFTTHTRHQHQHQHQHQHHTRMRTILDIRARSTGLWTVACPLSKEDLAGIDGREPSRRR